MTENLELIRRCKQRLADGVTVWCDWEKDVPALVEALIDQDVAAPSEDGMITVHRDTLHQEIGKLIQKYWR